MADDPAGPRPKGVFLNAEELKSLRAQKKFASFIAEAKAEYKQLKIVNERETLTASKNSTEHARWHHLCEMTLKLELVYFFRSSVGQCILYIACVGSAYI
jgi:hypothetical protein